MDVKLEWPVSSDAESLVDAIDGCRQRLIAIVAQKHNLQRVGVESCDAFVGSRLLELLRCSERCRPYDGDSTEDTTVPEHRRPRKPHESVASFPTFHLHLLPVLERSSDVRVVVTTDVGETNLHVLYGNVAVTGSDA